MSDAEKIMQEGWTPEQHELIAASATTLYEQMADILIDYVKKNISTDIGILVTPTVITAASGFFPMFLEKLCKDKVISPHLHGELLGYYSGVLRDSINRHHQNNNSSTH